SWALSGGSTAATVFNNILFVASGTGVSMYASADSQSGLVSDYNALMYAADTPDGSSALSLAQWQAATGQDQHSVAIRATDLYGIFADYAHGDYTLNRSGPGVDAGTASLNGQAAPAADGYFAA